MWEKIRGKNKWKRKRLVDTAPSRIATNFNPQIDERKNDQKVFKKEAETLA